MRVVVAAAARARSGEGVKSEPATTWYLGCQHGWEFSESSVGR